MKKIVLSFLLIFIVGGANAQTLTLRYAVQLKDETIGFLICKRIIQAPKTSYLLESKIHVQRIFNINVNYKVDAIYENGRLIHSTAKQISNERINFNTSTNWDGISYTFTDEHGKKTIKDKMIDFNLGSLYFTEPVNKTRIWSDSFGKFLSIKKVAPHRYELNLPEGKKNYYTYNYGICSMVETEQLFTKVTFLLTK